MSNIATSKHKYRHVLRKIERENDIIKRARDRRNYWKKVALSIESRYKAANEGQLEFPIMEGNHGQTK